MNIDILIPIVVIIGCIIIIVIQPTNKSEHLMQSDIILPNPVPTFISNLENKKDLIISNEDNNNSFPIKNIEIEAPTVKPYIPKPNEPYKDVNFDKIRDKGVDIKMKMDAKNNDEEYKQVVDAELNFEYPRDSGDFLTDINIKEIVKNNNNSTIADIFNKSTSTVINNISENQLKSILGTPIKYENNFNLYEPELVLIDKNLDTSDIINNITYKYYK
jgi:hypothetical protein